MVTEQIRAIARAAEGQARESRRAADEEAARIRSESMRAASDVLERIDQLEVAVQRAVASLRREADSLSALLERPSGRPATGRADADSAVVLDADAVEEPPPGRPVAIPETVEQPPLAEEVVDAGDEEATEAPDGEVVKSHLIEEASAVAGPERPGPEIEEAPEEPNAAARPEASAPAVEPEPEDATLQPVAQPETPETASAPAVEPEPPEATEPAVESETPETAVEPAVEHEALAGVDRDREAEQTRDEVAGEAAGPQVEALVVEEPGPEAGGLAIEDRGPEAAAFPVEEGLDAAAGGGAEPEVDAAETPVEETPASDTPRGGRLRSWFLRRSERDEAATVEPPDDPGSQPDDEGADLGAEHDFMPPGELEPANEVEPADQSEPAEDESGPPAPLVIQQGWWEEGIAPEEATSGAEASPLPEDLVDQDVNPGPVLAPGAVVEGYQVEGVLGRQSGSGIVYAAVDLSTGEPLALKMLPQSAAPNAAAIERFEEDLVRQTALDHPHIIETRGGGASETGPFVVMNLASGASLKNLVVFGELEDREVLDLLSPVAEALDLAERSGMPHRDLRPQKIIVVGDADRRAMIGDFGVGKPVRLEKEELVEHLDTLDYVAPERLRGEVGDAASNVYSLAAVVFECLAGSPPFVDERARAEDPTVQPESLTNVRPDLPERLSLVLQTAMAEAPGERYGTAEEMLREARAALGPGDTPD